jgi:hypothetical protein
MRHMCLAITFFMLVACQGSEIEYTGKSGSSLKGWGDARYVFSSKTITVCFEDRGEFDSAFSSYRNSIRDTVNSEFALTDLSLVGWKSCDSFRSLEDGIRLSFVGQSKLLSGVHAQSNLGTADGHHHFRRSFDGFIYGPTMTINTKDFLTTNETGGVALSAQNANTIIHEFGHAVGMMHEHVRNAGCDNFGEPSYGAMMKSISDEMRSSIYISTPDYDPTSIMDYCHVFDLARKGEQGGLSKGDVTVINQLYGGTLAGPPARSSELPYADDAEPAEDKSLESGDGPIVTKEEASGAATSTESPKTESPATSGSSASSGSGGEIISAIVEGIVDLLR